MSKGTPAAADRLFAALPLGQAMPELMPKAPRGLDLLALAEEAAAAGLNPPIEAALWLYVDDLERSHRVSQSIEGPVGARWHGIMHRREGDFANSRYWLHRSGPTPFEVDGYDPFALVDAAERSAGENPQELIELQRKEWLAFFDWCLEHAEEGQGK